MRLLFEKGFAPTHAFSAFYRWIREDFGAHAILHFGMHGALEFMPGKHAGLSGECWPDRLIGDAPNVYLYAANNPSEATLAKRRSSATMISHLTPPLAKAGLYKGLLELKDSLSRWRGAAPDAPERAELGDLIAEQAAAVDLDPTIGPEALWPRAPGDRGRAHSQGFARGRPTARRDGAPRSFGGDGGSRRAGRGGVRGGERA